MGLREIWLKLVDWVHLDEDRGQWQVLVNTVMSIWIP
jgi:hypothetical protein